MSPLTAALGVMIGAIIGLLILFLIIIPILERYKDKIGEWYSEYLKKWEK